MKSAVLTLLLILITTPLFAQSLNLEDTISWLSSNLEKITGEDNKYIKRTYTPLHSDDICIYIIKETQIQNTKDSVIVEEAIAELPLKELQPVFLYGATGEDLGPVVDGIRFETAEPITGIKNIRIKYRSNVYDDKEGDLELITKRKFVQLYSDNFKIDANVRSWSKPDSYKKLFRAFQTAILMCRNK